MSLFDVKGLFFGLKERPVHGFPGFQQGGGQRLPVKRLHDGGGQVFFGMGQRGGGVREGDTGGACAVSQNAIQQAHRFPLAPGQLAGGEGLQSGAIAELQPLGFGVMGTGDLLRILPDTGGAGAGVGNLAQNPVGFIGGVGCERFGRLGFLCRLCVAWGGVRPPAGA